MNPRPLPTTDVITNVDDMTPLPFDGAAGISTEKIWNPSSNPLRVKDIIVASHAKLVKSVDCFVVLAKMTLSESEDMLGKGYNNPKGRITKNLYTRYELTYII